MTQPTPSPFRDLMGQVQSIRDAVFAARDELNQTELVGESGNGLVSVTVRGSGEVIGVRLHADAKRQSLTELEDLFLAAATQAQSAAKLLTEKHARALDANAR